MTTKIMNTGILCGAVLATIVAGTLTSTAAQARGGKDFYSPSYQFGQQLDATRAGKATTTALNQGLPNYVCIRNGRCPSDGRNPASALLLVG